MIPRPPALPPTWRSTSNPDISGNATSISIKSGARFSAASMAARPDSASPSTCKSATRRHSSVNWERTEGSVSTMRSFIECRSSGHQRLNGWTPLAWRARNNDTGQQGCCIPSGHHRDRPTAAIPPQSSLAPRCAPALASTSVLPRSILRTQCSCFVFDAFSLRGFTQRR